MGVLTHSEIVTEALELAGNTGLTTRAQKWLGLVLRDLFERSPMALVSAGNLSTVPTTPNTISSGSTYLQVGGAGGGSDETVRSVRRVWICTYGDTDFSELPVEHVTTLGAEMYRPYTGAENVSTGRPRRVIAVSTQAASASSPGYVRLHFDPAPDDTYCVWVLTEGFLTAHGAYSASLVSMYPNDRTLVQGVYAFALRHQQDEREQAAFSEFETLASRDMIRFMQLNQANSKMRLSGRSFRSRGPGGSPWSWMGEK